MRHNKIGLLALTALTLTGMSVLAQAQGAGGGGRGGRGGGGFGGGQGGGFGGQRGGQFGGRPIQLADLSVATMDYGLTLTADQKSQIQTILTQRDTDTKALPAMTRPMPGQQMDDATRQAMQDAFQKRAAITTKANTDIQAVLTDDQKTKVPDFVKDLTAMQQAGIPVAIVGDLKLTDGQKKKIVAQAQTNQQAMQAKRQAMFQPGGQRPSPEEMQTMQTEMQAMQKDNTDKIMALLTPTQHAMIEDYNRAHPQPAFGGPGGGGFGGGRRGNGPGAGQGNGGAAGGN